jgi:hypothetical protein
MRGPDVSLYRNGPKKEPQKGSNLLINAADLISESCYSIWNSLALCVAAARDLGDLEKWGLSSSQVK